MAKTKKIRSREVTFEGKNIHFSPLDNKPLCSFSNKLCRQRRLNGFAFCIRHILEDKSSPFKQCDFVTRNNSQRCLNAIPSNQERGYCHSHMQVAGIIPKTERKVKPAPSSSPSSTFGTGKDSDSKKENKKKPSTRTDNIQYTLPLPTSSSLNCKVKKLALPSKTKGKSVLPATTEATKMNVKGLGTSLTVPGDMFLAGVHGKSSVVSLPKNGKPPIHKNGQILKSLSKPKQGLVATPVKQQENLNPEAGTDIGNLNLDLQFEQLKILKVSDLSKVSPIINAKLVKNELPQIDIPMVSPADEANDFLLIPPLLQLQKKTSYLSSNKDNKKFGTGKCYESRQEFLARVRSAFKSHYKVLRKTYKLMENHDDDNKSFRESLLSCVLADSRMSAKKILVNPQVENNCKVEERSSNRNGDKGSHSSPLNFHSNNNISTAANNKTAVTTQHNGGISYINSNFLRDFDENLSSEHFKESRFCDSSPWMNGGVHDISLGNGKKARSYNQGSKQYQHLAQSLISDGKVPSHVSKRNQRNTSSNSLGANYNNSYSSLENLHNKNISNHQLLNSISLRNEVGLSSHLMKKRRVDLENDFDELEHNLGLDLDGTSGSASHLLCSSHYSSVAHFETVLNSVSSSDTAGTPEGVMTDASFDSPFDYSTSSQPECDFSDDVDDLEKTFELQIDPEIAHQASRLLENNELTEDDFNELFPETRSLTDHKLGGDLGIDFTTTFDADIDYSLFANIFPTFRSNNSSEVISVTQNF